MKCRGCKYLEYRKATPVLKGRHLCTRFKDGFGLVFWDATDAYTLGCRGDYKKTE